MKMKRTLPLLIGTSLAGLAIAIYFAASGPKTLTTVEAASLPGTATLSGTVDSSKPFQAAQVYIRNVDKRMLYMVYTSGGQYRAINLFPGNYELSMRAKGLESEVQKLVLTAEQAARANVSLRDATSDPTREPGIEYLSYEEIYPPGPGRAVVERTCVTCHGANFLPSHQWNEAQWNAAIDLMRGGNNAGRILILDKYMNAQDREVAVQYLVKNFGPNSKKRAVGIDQDTPVDEQVLGKAMYIEYYFPPDPPGQGVNDPEYASRRRGQDPRFGPDGNVYVTDRGYPNRLVRLNPRTGEYKDWLLPNPKAGVHDLNIDQKSGMAWLPENHGFPRGQGEQLYLNGFNTKTEKWEARYPFNPDKVIPEGKQHHAHSLAIDSKGSVYVNMIVGDALSKWDRETKKITTFLLPTSITEAYGASPYGVVVDKNDNMWAAVYRRGKVAKFDTKTNQWTAYAAPTQPSNIRRLNVDSQNNIWFGLFEEGKLVKLDQATGKMTEWEIPKQGAQPYDVAAYGGNIWIADSGSGQRSTLIQFNPQTESFTFFPSPQPTADKPKIQITREGAIWYSPRSSRDYPGLGVLYPDMDKMTTFAAMY